MKISHVAKIFTGCALLATMSQGFADDLDISNIEGGWSNPTTNTGGAITISNVAAQGTDTASWGVPDTPAGPSAYLFTPAGDINDIPFDSPFLLGTFVHNNFPVFDPLLETIDYDMTFDTNGVPNNFGVTISFEHDETFNQAPCALPGTTICPDGVTVSTPSLFSPIDVDGTIHLFSLLGWSTDGTTFSSGLTLVTEEGQPNRAGLYGVITAPTVPEPGAISLLGLGLLGLGAMRLRKSRI